MIFTTETCHDACKIMSAASAARSVGFRRGSRVEGEMSRVEGRMPRAEGKMSRVQKCR